MKLALVYSHKEVEIKAFVTQVLKELSKNKPTAEGVIKIISNIKDTSDLTAVDGLRIMLAAWNETHESNEMTVKTYCTCKKLNVLKADISLDKINGVKKLDIHDGDLDFFGEKIQIKPTLLSDLDKGLSPIELLEQKVNIDISNWKLPKLKKLAELVKKEDDLLNELIVVKGKCYFCDELIESIITYSPDFF